MNWSRAKTILIILFLCTDLFLLGMYFTSRYSSSRISPRIIEDTVTVLKNNNITINPEIIPDKIQTVPYAEATNVISDYESFAKSVLGDNITQIKFGYENNTGKITFNGDSFEYTKNVGFGLDTAYVNDEQGAKDVASAELSRLGFDLSSASVNASKTENGFSVYFKNSVNSLPIFVSEVTANLSDKGITSISGIWFNKASGKGEDTELKKVTSALIDFVPQLPNGGEIVSLEKGYTIFDKASYHKSATLIPVWHISCKDGKTYILDARNP